MTDIDATAAGDRLAKVIARSGLCSRRDAEEWIRQGRVSVNGGGIRTPAFNVTPDDKIKVDGAPLAARSGTRLWLYHKPPGLVVTEKDPEGRATIFESLEEAGLPRVLTVGRLDLNTEGLLLLTNDGGLKRVLELPATGWLRRYRVRAFGSVSQAMLDGLKDGIEVDGIKYGPIEATLEREQGANVWLVVALREGKNREVKNVLGALGLEVNRLIRVSYGPFQLGDLPVGGVEVVKSRVLRDQLGKKLADEAGVDFDSEMPEVAAQKAAADPRRRISASDHAAPARTERSVRPSRPAAPRAARDEERPIQHRPGRSDPRPPRKPREVRPEGPARRVLFDDHEGRAPEEFRPTFERKPRDDKPGFDRGARDARPPRGPRPDGPPRGDRPDRPPRSDRPDRPPRGDRPDRASGPRPSRPGGPDRPSRSFAGPRTEQRSDRPDRAPRGDRPDRPRSDRPASAPRTQRPDRRPRAPGAERPRTFSGPRAEARGDRPDRAPRGDRPDRPRSDKPVRSPRPERPAGARPPRRDAAPARGPGGPRSGPKPAGSRERGRPSTGQVRGPAPGGRPPRPGGPRPPRKPRA